MQSFYCWLFILVVLFYEGICLCLFLKRETKVALLGASGGIGQPLALLLKLNPLISHLALYDIVHTPGVAADISHCSTPAKVTGHLGQKQLRDALEGSQVVVVPAGVPRKPGNIYTHNIYM